MKEYPRRLHHATPPWVESGALFHIRIRIDAGQPCPLTEARLSSDLIEAAKRYHRLAHWRCELFLLMPDHLHALLRFSRDPGMPMVIDNWKRGVARFQDVHWQDGFFDHRIRSRQEAQEKWHYIRLNPVVKGLCEKPDGWPHWWSSSLGGTH